MQKPRLSNRRSSNQIYVLGVNRLLTTSAVNIEIPPSACGKMVAREFLRDLTGTEPKRMFGNYYNLNKCPRMDSIK